eukprot:5072100-Alexandrium_andersonii.AAC.1
MRCGSPRHHLDQPGGPDSQAGLCPPARGMATVARPGVPGAQTRAQNPKKPTTPQRRLSWESPASGRMPNTGGGAKSA